jgi:aldehyde dehydrogenase (NAD+)
MDRAVGPRLAARFARAMLELGGNNAAIVAPRSISIWQSASSLSPPWARPTNRCTTPWRVFAHANVYERLVRRLSQVNGSVKVADPH